MFFSTTCGTIVISQLYIGELVAQTLVTKFYLNSYQTSVVTTVISTLKIFQFSKISLLFKLWLFNLCQNIQTLIQTSLHVVAQV